MIVQSILLKLVRLWKSGSLSIENSELFKNFTLHELLSAGCSCTQMSQNMFAVVLNLPVWRVWEPPMEPLMSDEKIMTDAPWLLLQSNNSETLRKDTQSLWKVPLAGFSPKRTDVTLDSSHVLILWFCLTDVLPARSHAFTLIQTSEGGSSVLSVNKKIGSGEESGANILQMEKKLPKLRI